MKKNKILIYGILSSFVIIATDIVLFGANAAAFATTISGILAPVGITTAIVQNILLPLFAGVLVFMIELIEKKDIGKAFVLALTASFIIAIPTPIAGLATGVFSGAKNLKMIK